MAVTITSVLKDVNTISASLNENVLVVQAKESIKEGLDIAELTTEERDRLFSNFVQQLALGVLGQAIALAKEVPIINLNADQMTKQNAKLTAKLQADIDILNKQKTKLDKDISVLTKQENKLDKDIAILEIQRSKLGAKLDKEIAVLEEQRKGFKQNDVYKGMNVLSQQTSMFAQAEEAPPAWMAGFIQTGASKLIN